MHFFLRKQTNEQKEKPDESGCLPSTESCRANYSKQSNLILSRSSPCLCDSCWKSSATNALQAVLPNTVGNWVGKQTPTVFYYPLPLFKFHNIPVFQKFSNSFSFTRTVLYKLSLTKFNQL